MEQIPDISFNLDINGEMFERNIKDDLLFSEHNLDECLENQASLFAYYSIIFQKANAAKVQAEFEYDKIINETTKIIREEFLISNNKITDKQLTAVVNAHEDVLNAKRRCVECAIDRDKMYSLMKSIEQKKDCLITYAYQKRSELEMLGRKNVKIPKSGLEDE